MTKIIEGTGIDQKPELADKSDSNAEGKEMESKY